MLLSYVDFNELIIREISMEDYPMHAIFAYHTKFALIEKPMIVYRIMSESVSHSKHYEKKMKYLILEANSKVDVLREFLSSNCFEIMDEDVVFEKDKYYEILIIRFNSKIEQLTKTEIEFGPVLLKKKNDIFKEYLMDKLNKLNLGFVI
jgi:hypothetical protein